MSTGTPNNTLDFSHAKLVARISEISPLLVPGNDIPSRLTQKLQMTLDIAEQIRIFVEALSELIEVEGVRYLNELPQVHLQSERMGVHRCHYTLNLPDAELGEISFGRNRRFLEPELKVIEQIDRKSTRLNSSHVKISYAVFCLKKKKKKYYYFNKQSTHR